MQTSGETVSRRSAAVDGYGRPEEFVCQLEVLIRVLIHSDHINVIRNF